jgi:hypothetical protein
MARIKIPLGKRQRLPNGVSRGGQLNALRVNNTVEQKTMIPRKKLRSLYWAEVHMREARDASAHLLDLGDAAQELSHAIYTGIVVSYARSFGANQGLSALPVEFRKFGDPKLQKLHDFVLEARDTIYAHKDEIKEGDKLAAGLPREALSRIKFHIADSGVCHWIVQRPGLPPAYLKDIMELCEFQMARMNAASRGMLAKCCQGKSYAPGDYVLGETFP